MTVTNDLVKMKLFMPDDGMNIVFFFGTICVGLGLFFCIMKNIRISYLFLVFVGFKKV